MKAIRVDDKSTVTEQVLAYKKALAREKSIDEEKIICMLATPLGFSQEVIDTCQKYGVIAKTLDEQSLIQSTPRNRTGILSGFFSDTENESDLLDLLQRRRIAIDTSGMSDETASALKSAKTWLSQHVHDNFGKKALAVLFQEISSKAPLMAHETFTSSNGSLRYNEDKWFWLFYSVLDRRANASTFVNARNALDRQGLFNPRNIINLVDTLGEDSVILRITEILENAGFALLVDNGHGKRAYPQSIIDAARLMKKYNYDFDCMYKTHLERNDGNPAATFQSVWKELTDEIYGVGPRIAAQFIRGMTLKASWNLPLLDERLLEVTPLNCRFAGSPRFALVESESTYRRELAEFADKYLNGNRAIISHVLWYIRKRYCDKVPNCNECPMTGYCTLFLKLREEGTLSNYRVRNGTRKDEDRLQTTLTTF